MLIIPNITIESAIKRMISQVSDGNNSPTMKLQGYFIILMIMSCLFSLRFLRDLGLWFCLSEVKIHGSRGRHVLDNVRGSVLGLTCFIP